MSATASIDLYRTRLTERAFLLLTGTFRAGRARRESGPRLREDPGNKRLPAAAVRLATWAAVPSPDPSRLHFLIPRFARKLRNGALRDPPSRPGPVPRAALRTAGRAGPRRAGRDLPGRRPAGLGPAAGVVPRRARLRG